MGPAYHNIHLIHAPRADGGGDQLRHLAVTQVHVRVERRGQLDLGQIFESHLFLCLVQGQLVVVFAEGDFFDDAAEERSRTSGVGLAGLGSLDVIEAMVGDLESRLDKRGN